MGIRKNTYRTIITNLLIAIGISLIVNFSIFIFRFMPKPPVGGGGERGWFRMIESDHFQFIQFTFYTIFAFILLIVATARQKDGKPQNYLLRILLCTAIALTAYFAAPVLTRRGDIILNIHSHRLFDPTLLTKISFTLIVSVLYGKINDLVTQRQNIIIENEVLKNENLQSTYNTLINQINPHFFFNSLNSLSMLVREKHNQQALTYIDRLSDTFRYIIRNGQTGATALDEELKFVDAYKYLLEIRYEGKLFFDIDIENKYSHWTLPSLTLQPLIENVVKHNVITKSNPMTISIRTHEDALIVSNPIYPKMHEDETTGIGIENLSRRYALLTGKDINVSNNSKEFSVSLPLSKPIE